MSAALIEHSDHHNMFSDKPKPGNPLWRYMSFVGADAATPLTPADSIYDPACYYNTKYPTDQALSTALINSYSGSALPGISWPHDPTMMKYARAVMCYYNRDRPGPSNGSKWDSRSDLFFFDAAVKYFKKFNYKYKYTNTDCYTLRDMSQGIDNERTSILQQRSAGSFGTGEEGVYLTILKDLQSNIDNASASLSCTNYINTTEQQQSADLLQNQLEKAKTLTGDDKTATYVVIGVIFLIVAATGYILYKARKAS